MTLEIYLNALEENDRLLFQKLYKTIKNALPEEFEEQLEGKMINYVVPHSIYPKGYHCNPKQALPYLSLTYSKSSFTLHHIGLYMQPNLLDEFKQLHLENTSQQLDTGKGCIRFKKKEGSIPLDLITLLCSKMSITEYIELYEAFTSKNT